MDKAIRITLKSMLIENFKGITKFKTTFGDNVTVIKGKNGLGKTSLYDAWLWLTTDKDSLGASKFCITPIDTKTKKEKDHLTTAVEVTYEAEDTDGTISTHTARKEYREVWKTEKGEIEEKLVRHETVCSFDGAKIQSTKFIGSLFGTYFMADTNKDIIKLVTNPLYFTENCDAKTQREYLGNIVNMYAVDTELCEDEKYQDLAKRYWASERVGNTTYAKKVASQNIETAKARINQEKIISTEWMAQLSESAPKLQLTENPTYQEISAKIDFLNDTNKQTLESEKTIITQNNGGKTETRTKLNEKANELSDALINSNKNKQNKVDEINKKIEKFNEELMNATADLRSANRDLQDNTNLIESLNKKLIDLREDYKKLAKTEIDKTCPMCGSPLSPDKIREAEVAKADKLADIAIDGSNAKQDYDKACQETITIKARISEAKTNCDSFGDELAVLRKQLDDAKSINPYDDETYLKTKAEYDKLAQQVDAEENTPIDAKIDEIHAKLQEIQDDLILANRLLDVRKRYDEAKENARRGAIEKAQGEKDLMLIEQYNIDRSTIIESTINSKFNIVEFRLFESTLTGAVHEICAATVDGVPYNSLNHAMRINAGLDIIKTFSAIDNTKLPIFIDNAEAINNIQVDPSLQVIELRVTDDDELTVEIK